MLEEKWYPMSGYEGFYEITKSGKVRSLYKHNLHYEMQQRIDRAGYMTVRLRKRDKGSTQTIHRLLALTFIPNPVGKKCVNHKDGNKLNNSLSNLEWCTASENMKHAYEIGLCQRGGQMKKVIDACTGDMFESIKAAAHHNKIPYPTLKQKLKGFRKNDTCLKYAA